MQSIKVGMRRLMKEMKRIQSSEYLTKRVFSVELEGDNLYEVAYFGAASSLFVRLVQYFQNHAHSHLMLLYVLFVLLMFPIAHAHICIVECEIIQI